MNTTSALRIVGITDEVSTCDCCGKNDLKRAVALEGEEGEVVFFGTTCTAIALGRDAKEVRKESKKAQDRRDEARRAAEQAKRDAEFVLWVEFARAKAGMPNAGMPEILAAMGGQWVNETQREFRNR